jgi:hypothetical protein
MNPELVPPDWVMVAFIAVVFVWGFSKRVEVDAESTGNAGVGVGNGNGKTPALAELEHTTEDQAGDALPASAQTSSDVEYAEPS